MMNYYTLNKAPLNDHKFIPVELIKSINKDAGKLSAPAIAPGSI